MVPVAAPKVYSILLADNLTMVREGLVAVCEQPQYRVVAQCAEGAAALRLIESQKPDIAVLDMNLPDLFTLEMVRELRETKVSTRIVVLSTRRDRKAVVEALRAGVDAFVLKSQPAVHLFEAFERILDGCIYVSSSLTLDRIFTPKQVPAPENLIAALNSREYQVFSLLAEGKRLTHIADQLKISTKTVAAYRGKLMRKLDIPNVAGLIKFAIQSDQLSVW